MNTNTVYITKTSLKQNHSHKNMPLSIAYSTIFKFSFFIFLFAEKTIKRETANNINSSTVITINILLLIHLNLLHPFD